MRVKFLLTADPVVYAPMLAVSSTSTRAFCALNGFECETFVGLKYGRTPWHARFNRIALINEQLDAGYDGWIVFLDTDAFVVDLRFDLAAYLHDFEDRAMILRPAVPGAQGTARINSGVLLVNAGHPRAVRAMRGWRRLVEVAGLVGQLAVDPEYCVVSDQKLLRFLLQFNPGVRRATHYESPLLINGAEASFIAHYLLSDVPDLDMRVAMIAARIDRAFAEAGVDPAPYRAG